MSSLFKFTYISNKGAEKQKRTISKFLFNYLMKKMIDSVTLNSYCFNGLIINIIIVINFLIN